MNNSQQTMLNFDSALGAYKKAMTELLAKGSSIYSKEAILLQDEHAKIFFAIATEATNIFQKNKDNEAAKYANSYTWSYSILMANVNSDVSQGDKKLTDSDKQRLELAERIRSKYREAALQNAN